MRRASIFCLLLVASLCSWSCASDDPDPGTGGGGGTAGGGGGMAGGGGESTVDMRSVELGTGRLAFEPLLSGDEVGIFAGFQGGYHVFFSIRLFELPNEDVTIEAELLDGQGERISFSYVRTVVYGDLDPVDGGGRERVGDLLRLDTSDPSVYYGEGATLRSIVSHPSGDPIVTTVPITLVEGQ